MTPRRCSRCRLLKATYCYYADGRSKDGLTACCRSCHRDVARESARRRYPAIRARKLEKQRAWRRANKAKHLAYNREWKRRMREAKREEAAA